MRLPSRTGTALDFPTHLKERSGSTLDGVTEAIDAVAVVVTGEDFGQRARAATAAVAIAAIPNRTAGARDLGVEVGGGGRRDTLKRRVRSASSSSLPDAGRCAGSLARHRATSADSSGET